MGFVGSTLGIIFGKVFCSWACSIGLLLMEFTMSTSAYAKFRQMCQYHKLGCPIDWISFYLKRLSIFREDARRRRLCQLRAYDKVC